MTDQIYRSKVEKITSADVRAVAVDPDYEPRDAALQSHGPRPTAINMGGDHSEALPADNRKPLYNSRIINTYVEFLEKFYPQVDIDAVLQQSEMTRHEVEDPGHWFTQHQTNRFNEIVIAKSGNPTLAREVGRFTISSERVGAHKQYALGSISLASIYKKVGKLAAALSRGAEISSKKLASNKVEIISRPTPETVEKPYQ